MPPSDTNDFDNLGLPALESKLKTDLKCLLYDGKNWVPPRKNVKIVSGRFLLFCLAN